jgi:hypothetical protein
MLYLFMVCKVIRGTRGRASRKSNTKSSRGFRRLFGKGTSKKSKSSENATDDVEYWPEELLPDDQENVRVFTYGYESHVTKGYFSANSKSSIFTHGSSFLLALGRQRLKCKGRLIIFVAHSLGGLVVKQALIEAKKQEPHDPTLYDVYLSSFAVIFFGTPHRGSDVAYWASVFSTIAEAVQVDANQKILRDLSPDASNLRS